MESIDPMQTISVGGTTSNESRVQWTTSMANLTQQHLHAGIHECLLISVGGKARDFATIRHGF